MLHRRGKEKPGKQPSTQLGHNSQGSKSQSKKKGNKNIGKKSQSQQEVMGNQSVRVPEIGSLDYTIPLFAHNLHKGKSGRIEYDKS